MICSSGPCKVYVNNGNSKSVFLLNSPTQILHLDPVDWREMYDFSNDCILSCFCDEMYNPSDYIYTPYRNVDAKNQNFDHQLEEEYFEQNIY